MTATPPELTPWLATLLDSYGLGETDLDIAAVLDLARDAAHHVARPAAPLTAFVAGLAAGKAGGSPADISAALARATELALAQGSDG